MEQAEKNFEIPVVNAQYLKKDQPDEDLTNFERIEEA